MQRTIGIDIGTTSICALVMEPGSRTVLKALTVPNGTEIPGEHPWNRCQDPEAILAKCRTLLDTLLAEYDGIGAIGVTGQMHGIVYYDAQGKTVSPLYTWQDESGNQPHPQGGKWCDVLSCLSGYPLATGYGLVTHACKCAEGTVPETAVGFCTIHDCLVMGLTGNAPLCHATDAASFGCYDLENHCFDLAALEKMGLDSRYLPRTTRSRQEAGSFRGIPVYPAIGDNQASFLGAVKDMTGSVLINIGTGSQISVMTDRLLKTCRTEVRPFLEDRYLLVGASLCGGRAYAALENFFRLYAQAAGFPGSQYGVMESLTQAALTIPREEKLLVKPLFCGTRSDIQVRGTVENISLENLTPAHLIAGFLEGTVEELLEFYREAEPMLGTRPTTLVGSGNGLRRGAVWQQIARDKFAMALEMSDVPEEAACGAAIFASGEYQL